MQTEVFDRYETGRNDIAADRKIAFIDKAHPSVARKFWARLVSCWRETIRGGMMRLKDRRARTLRLGETLQLGDRRFVAVIEFEKARFLLGGTHTSLALLARLDREIAAIPSVDAMDAAPKKADASNEPKEERD